MKQLFVGFLALLLLNACGGKAESETTTTEETKVEYDFRTFTWDDSPLSILDAEAPKQAKIYESDGVTEYEFEDTFLGVKTELDMDNVARMACFFADSKLKGAWYYIYTSKDKFDMNKEVEAIKAKLGAPDSLRNDAENATDHYVWLKDRTAVKMLARDAGDKYRFEVYYYERQWYNANMVK